IDPLMGWTSSGDTRTQVKMKFDTKDAALAYARKHGVVAQVIEPAERKLTIRPMGYGGNFAHKRRLPWSH
ncbi:MAG: NADH dehydrogenase ubiquinone Fe-S protein 4, partial [Pseudomonadota bacterium]